MLFDPRRQLRRHRPHPSNLRLGHGVTVRKSRAADSRDDRVMSDVDELTDYVDTELISRALFGATE